jgi:hypothetical protein
MHAMLEPRQMRGMEIAACANLIQKGKAWIVPSQSGKGRYTVCPDDESPHCTFPDHETRGVKCKHIFAVEYAIRSEEHCDGTATVTETMTVRETVSKTIHRIGRLTTLPRRTRKSAS